MGAKTRKLSQINDSLIEWQSVVVADGSTGLTAVAGRGYFINTTAGAITVTFPASPKIGDTIILNDYASTFATNNVTINFNGNKLEADTSNGTLSTNDQTHTFVFTDATQGWKIVNQDTGTGIQPLFISATGGTVLTNGDFKTHVFTGDGCFVVSSLGNPISGPAGSNVDYLVVAGGGGAGYNAAGGGGAGGYRTTFPSPGCNAGSFPVTATTFPITVGGGGAAGCSGSVPVGEGVNGNNSVFSTITSSGGGGGGRFNAPLNGAGKAGGSGGGAMAENLPGGRSGGTGNSPPTSPSQGNPGGTAPAAGGGGGGGAGAAGTNASGNDSGPGGVGSPMATTFFGPTAPSYGTPGPAPGRYFAGGGGGSAFTAGASSTGGAGGGGTGANNGGDSGDTNTGGGGGANNFSIAGGNGGAGGSGIVVIRYKFQ